MGMSPQKLFTASLCAWVGLLSIARAEGVGVPTGPILLSVLTGPEETVEVDFDAEMLGALPQTTFRTSTIWTSNVHSYTGVALNDFIAALQVTPTHLQAIAINDYSMSIPVSDVVAGGPILAYLSDGKPMSLRDKGPVWLIYPFDSNAAYQTEVVYARSVWQLNRLKIYK